MEININLVNTLYWQLACYQNVPIDKELDSRYEMKEDFKLRTSPNILFFIYCRNRDKEQMISWLIFSTKSLQSRLATFADWFDDGSNRNFLLTEVYERLHHTETVLIVFTPYTSFIELINGAVVAFMSRTKINWQDSLIQSQSPNI